MKNYDVVVIGAGLGGLQSAYILAKKGMKVCVLEQNRLLGGCLQTFSRKGTNFDTGFHYVGGLDNGQPLYRLFKYFNLLDLPWHKLDTNGFDEVYFNDKSYMFVNGYDNFCQKMSEYFPNSVNQLNVYTKFLKHVGEDIFDSFSNNPEQNMAGMSLFGKGAYNYLTETISDPILQNVLSGTSPKLSLNKQKLPLYTFAQINSSFIQSAYRLNGGGMQIAQSLANSIEKLGGEVFTNAKVVNLVEQNEKLAIAEIENNEPIQAKYFISNVHPASTIRLAENTSFVRKIYKKRITTLENGFGMFTVNIKLKPGMFKYLNRNVYIHNTDDIWTEGEQLASELPRCVLVSFAVPKNNQEYAENVDLLTPMLWSDVEKFAGTKIGNRGEEYETLKFEKSQQLINLADKYLPGLKNAVENIYTSTPLTYADYTATENGSAFGITKDYDRLVYTLLTPKTPIPNLWLTGQNLNLHGILGVSMTSFFSCAEILGESPSIKMFEY
ncbi:MAG: NAD(P)/FAD-dependent oxidoreductase [Bacteroidales bacterium]|nr:NAD(P)/FAD-dependent oxidoreductase [Bacteroidales bacterium]